jgi:uncharacterized protein (DUF1015 family)
MAEILPIRPWRYNRELEKKIDSLTSPLFDVVSEKQRKTLYQNPHNSIHLSVPQEPNAPQRAADLTYEWKRRGILVQDKVPGIYVYYQYFRLSGSSKEFCRKGFICHIKAYDWEEKVILRHENTIPNAVNDRVDLLEKTELHVNPTHGLFTDPEFELEKYMDIAISDPIYVTEDYQGVRDTLGVIHDAVIIQKFIDRIKSRTIILADGHHRYEGSLIYKQKRKQINPHHHGREGYNFHLMYLTNTEADDLRILPTHRIINGIKAFDEETIMRKLADYFVIKPIEDADTLNEIIVGKPWAFGLLFKDNAYKIILKPEAYSTLSWPFPEQIKMLDLTVMHYFIIEKILNIPGKLQRQSDNITFDRSFSDCLKKVLQGNAQMAIITNEVSIDDVKNVCRSGFTMPQKSTYFYPKVIGGFLFSSIRQEEFESPFYSPF